VTFLLLSSDGSLECGTGREFSLGTEAQRFPTLHQFGDFCPYGPRVRQLWTRQNPWKQHHYRL